ncbi:hypothetical protein [Tritonibacter mobilis]|uniref:hypothetical protein n=1 Tax=Tritonibacter mobilis TaxID=379347 RepID=UPI000F7D5AA6|nr:hypothetical protein [Tritonibacter mobilis]
MWRVSASPAPDPILIHPSMAVTYRERVAALIAGLGRSAEMPAAAEALRGLISEVRMVPDTAARNGHTIELIGDDEAQGHWLSIEGNLLEMLRKSAPRDLDAVRGDTIFAEFGCGSRI